MSQRPGVTAKSYHPAGPTSMTRSLPATAALTLCRRHHQAKQAPGWHLDQPQPGIMTWTLPHGRKYLNKPAPYP